MGSVSERRRTSVSRSSNAPAASCLSPDYEALAYRKARVWDLLDKARVNDATAVREHVTLGERTLESIPEFCAGESDEIERGVLGKESSRVVEPLEDVASSARDRLGVWHSLRELLAHEDLE